MKTVFDDSLDDEDGSVQRAPRLCLVLVWSRDEPARVGEVILCPEGIHVIGRADPDAAEQPLPLYQQRPGSNHNTGPLQSSRISRRQLVVHAVQGALSVTNEGRARMRISGQRRVQSPVQRGDLIEIERRVSLLCVERPDTLPGTAARPQRFGAADAHGIVGESLAAWKLRAQLSFVAPRPAHVLVLGESGTGKELAARAVHAQSRRASGPMVARNAATIPEGLVDAELFGNAKNYPNPGMASRLGVIGEASGGTLFLDEIGEMPHEHQAHLLRTLDEGEYHRLGESRSRTADIRLVAATNRAIEELKHDFVARLPIRVRIPGLGERREDIPLLVRHLLHAMVAEDPTLNERFLSDGEPRLSQGLVYQLCTWPWSTHVRELQALLWKSMLESPGQSLEPIPTDTQEAPDGDGELTRARLAAVLEAAGGNKTRAAQELGLRNRHQLHRLLKKHGLG